MAHARKLNSTKKLSGPKKLRPFSEGFHRSRTRRKCGYGAHHLFSTFINGFCRNDAENAWVTTVLIVKRGRYYWMPISSSEFSYRVGESELTCNNFNWTTNEYHFVLLCDYCCGLAGAKAVIIVVITTVIFPPMLLLWRWRAHIQMEQAKRGKSIEWLLYNAHREGWIFNALILFLVNI